MSEYTGRLDLKAAGISLWPCPGFGRLAQLAERLVYTEKVGGSTPSSPTKPQSDSSNRLMWKKRRTERKLVTLYGD